MSEELNFVEIGLKIKERRNQLDYTQEYVASELGVNPSHISNIECAHTKPSLTALVSIANVLRCSVDLFLCDEYDYNKNDVRTLKETPYYDRLNEKLIDCPPEKIERILKMIDLM